MEYDIPIVMEKYWKPVIAEIEKMLQMPRKKHKGKNEYARSRR